MLRIRLGEQAALGELMDRHWKPLVRYALRFLGDLDGAEDAVQEAFVRVWAKRADWVPSGNPRSFLYRIVRNLVLQEREKREVRRRWREARPPEEPAGDSPDDSLEADTLRRDLDRAIGALPARRQEIVVLARFHGLSYRQISEVMEISPQTVANQMSAALRELRVALAMYGP